MKHIIFTLLLIFSVITVSAQFTRVYKTSALFNETTFTYEMVMHGNWLVTFNNQGEEGTIRCHWLHATLYPTGNVEEEDGWQTVKGILVYDDGTSEENITFSLHDRQHRLLLFTSAFIIGLWEEIYETIPNNKPRNNAHVRMHTQ